jgi:hypothetical protein
VTDTDKLYFAAGCFDCLHVGIDFKADLGCDEENKNEVREVK